MVNKWPASVGTYLDNGHYLITGNRAGRLCKDVGGLPIRGWERRIRHEGKAYWIARTVHQGASRWTIREGASHDY